MKTSTFLSSLCFALFSTLCFSAMAQQAAVTDSISSKSGNKFFVGAEVTTIHYIMGNREAAGGFSPYAQLHVGYKLSRRANVQIGLAFGKKKEDELSSIYYGDNDTIIYYNRSLNHKGIAIPLSLQYTPFRPSNRLNLYATASLIPVFGEANVKETETYEGETKIIYNGHDSGMYLLATAGLVLNYKFNKRFEGYSKANLLYRHVGHYNLYADKTKSIAIGLNYNL